MEVMRKNNMLREWEHLPKYLQNKAVRPYYEKLEKKKVSHALRECLMWPCLPLC